jgi:hypothetical protein
MKVTDLLENVLSRLKYRTCEEFALLRDVVRAGWIVVAEILSEEFAGRCPALFNSCVIGALVNSDLGPVVDVEECHRSFSKLLLIRKERGIRVRTERNDDPQITSKPTERTTHAPHAV